MLRYKKGCGENLYFGDFECKEDIERQFRITLTDEEIIFASYVIDGYEGSALVVFKKLNECGKMIFYEVHGSHCSCSGLEGQWDPELIPEELVDERLKAF